MSPEELLDGVPREDRGLVATALSALETAPADIGAHSRRMIIIAQVLAAPEPVDLGLLATACCVHDLGMLTDGRRRWPERSFAERSSALLAQLAADHGVAAERTEVWCVAVRDHLRARGGPEETVEASLLRRAAWLDATRIGAAEDRRRVRALHLDQGAGESVRLLVRVGVSLVRDRIR